MLVNVQKFNMITTIKNKIDEIERKLKEICLNDIAENREYFIGDFVYSNADAKETNMIIRIVGKKLDKDTKKILYKCTYESPEYLRKLGWKKKYFWNAGAFLRSPDRLYGETTIKENELKRELQAYQECLKLLEKFEIELKNELIGKDDDWIEKIIDKLLHSNSQQESSSDSSVLLGISNPADTLNSQEEMYCAIEGCGEIDDTFTAYCIKHGRSPHKIRKINSQEKEKPDRDINRE